MLFKTVGFYSLLLGILTLVLFIYVLLGNRTMYFVVINLSVIGIIAAVIGLILDKTKMSSIIALILCVTPHMVLWIMNALRK